MNMGRRTFVLVGGLASLCLGAGGGYLLGPILSGGPDVEHARKDVPPELRLERSERLNPLSGVVMAGDLPLDDAWVTAGDQQVYTDETGAFSFESVPLGVVTVTRPGYKDVEYVFDGSVDEVDIPMEVRIIKSVHISSSWATDDAVFQEFLDLTEVTTVNSLLLDAMGDDGYIDYNTKVQAAIDHGMITETPYNVEERLRQMKDAGLYSIIRVSVFANPLAVRAFPQNNLGGGFLDPGKPDSWTYPLDLAIEACNLGFDEISFDYIRYPSQFYTNTPKTQEGRAANIRAFLQEAADRLHPLGCAVSASTFGGPTMVTNDFGVGQLVEEFTVPIDVYAPMTYPELWTDNPIFGISKPQYKPKEVVTAQLDSVLPRIAEGTVLRPWLQSSYYPSDWILVQIQVAEDRGLGWIIWNSFDDPNAARVSSFPPGTTGEG